MAMAPECRRTEESSLNMWCCDELIFELDFRCARYLRIASASALYRKRGYKTSIYPG